MDKQTNPTSRRQRPTADIIPFTVPRIAPDDPGGWFVVLGKFGWLYGSRPEALIALRELMSEVRS
jgi:hypothetical protein